MSRCPYFPPERGVNVLSLAREKTMYSVSQSDRLDEADQPVEPTITTAAEALKVLGKSC